MDSSNYKEALEMLRQSGLTRREICRLQNFSRRYVVSEMDRSLLDPRRLEFARWLVTTHRLTEQINPG